jgi:predicted nucleic-acid-binding protein
MIGIDTNILVRYLTQDDVAQSAKATEIMEEQLSTANPGFVSVVAMTVQEIAAAIERMLQVEVLVIENEQEVFAAMIALKQGRGAFSDALIAELGPKAGCSYTLTFDKKALRLRGFKFP